MERFLSVLECPHIPPSTIRTDATEPEPMVKVLESSDTQSSES